MSVTYELDGEIAVVTLYRPEARNAVDGPTAQALYDAFKRFDADEAAKVAVLTGGGGCFCAGADLKGIAGRGNPVHREGDLGPMGPTRLALSKPVIAAVEGFAVAGGLELALWCDLRVAAEGAIFGVFCRRFGVPLIDLGTVRLPRLIGHSRAMDLILTGRPVAAAEAQAIGLANRIAPDGQALATALDLARQIAGFPQTCLRNDRRSALEQWSLSWDEATAFEIGVGFETLQSGESAAGAARFGGGEGRGGAFR
ncbi:MAG TPA: crotonase/enoyl-CoA hydratase family protein [Caulobacter sp.]|nr:crotonase/enoyl-CoA hydratase family protein [Caulobacter sp.]